MPREAPATAQQQPALADGRQSATQKRDVAQPLAWGEAMQHLQRSQVNFQLQLVLVESGKGTQRGEGRAT